MPDLMTVTLAPLTHADPAAIEPLLDAAFGRDRHTRTAYRIREGAAWLPALSFAALADGTLVALLQSWPVALAGCPLVLVGPVAVAPVWQGQGLGRALMERLLAAAGDTPLTMIGDPEYYARFGFDAAATAGWQVPGPVERRRLLARASTALPRVGVLGPRVAPTAVAA